MPHWPSLGSIAGNRVLRKVFWSSGSSELAVSLTARRQQLINPDIYGGLSLVEEGDNEAIVTMHRRP